MAPQAPLRDAERDNYAFFLELPEVDRTARQAGRQEHAVPRAAVRVLRARAPAAAKRRTSSC